MKLQRKKSKRSLFCVNVRRLIEWAFACLQVPHLNSIVEQFLNKPKHLNKDEAMAWRAFDLNFFNRTPPIYQFVSDVLLIAAELRKRLSREMKIIHLPKKKKEKNI